MWRVLKWLGVGLVVLVVLGAAAVYAASEWRLARRYDAPAEALTAEAASPEEGARRARTFGCTGCHGAAGDVIFEADGVGRLVAPNLTRVVADYSDAELVRVIRHGVERDGTSVIAMPTESFRDLADEDVAAIIAWLRGLAPAADAEPDGTHWGPLGRVALALGKVPMGADAGAPATPPAVRPRGTPVDEGRYLVRTICLHCHELDRRHDDGFGMVTPPLAAMAASYSSDEFRHLLATGEGLGGRDLGLMSEVARSGLSALEPGEAAAMHAYLGGVAEGAAP